MKRGRLIGVIGVLAAITWVIYLSVGTQQISCEVCMEFNGRTQCLSAAGPTREEAVRTATSAACATLARGMDQSMRCEQTSPKSINCRQR